MATSFNEKMTLAPGTGGQFGIRTHDFRGKLQGNPIPYLMPWLMAFTLLAIAMAIRFALVRDQFAWYWSVFVASVYCGLTYITWRSSRPRGHLVNRLATGGVAVAGLWAFVVDGMPHMTWRPFFAYFLLAAVFCLGSNVFVAFRNQAGDGSDQHGGVLAKIQEIQGAYIKDGQVVATYGMEPGTPAKDLQQAGPALASLYGVPPDGVRIVPNKNNGRLSDVVISPNNPLDRPAPWTGPSIREGGSIMEPIVVGVRRGGQPLQFWLPGSQRDGRNASLVQVTGMAGAGKTEFIRTTTVELLSRGMPDEVEYWYLNSRKADQEPGWVKKGAARFENTRKGVAAALRELRDEASERARIIGAKGLDEWAPGCGLPFRLVICDEFADVATDIERIFVDLAETLRSLGVILMCGFQRASGNRFPTDARSNFGTHACFGVKDEVDAGMALPEEVIDAGAQPWLWGNKQAGMCYLTAPGVPEDVWTDSARTFKPNRDLMAKWAEYYIARRNGAQATAPASPERPVVPAQRPVVVSDAEVVDGDLVDDDDTYDTEDDTDTDFDGEGDVTFDPTFRPNHDETDDDRDREGLDDVIDLDDFDEDRVADDAEDALREVADELGEEEEDLDDDGMPPKPVIPADCRDVLNVDHREPIEVVGGGMQLSLSPQMPSREARQYVRRFLATLHGQGIGRFKKEDMAGDLLAEVGYRTSWLDKVLKEFCGERPTWLRKTDERGWYDIVAAPVQAIGGDTP